MIRLRRVALPVDLLTRLSERAERLRIYLETHQEPPRALLDAYRDPDLKAHLIAEAHGKCIYCESKITHVYFGDVEHIRPKAAFPMERLVVANLALACAHCNNAKGEFWDPVTTLLDPYADDPDQELLAFGYFLVRRPGRDRARVTIEHLALNRQALLERRKERIELLQPLADQYVLAPDGALKELLRSELCRQASDDSEYAFIVRAYLDGACSLPWREAG